MILYISKDSLLTILDVICTHLESMLLSSQHSIIFIYTIFFDSI